jgi:hypothetical protein
MIKILRSAIVGSWSIPTKLNDNGQANICSNLPFAAFPDQPAKSI